MKGKQDFLVSTFLKGHVIGAGRLGRSGQEEVFSEGHALGGEQVELSCQSSEAMSAFGSEREIIGKTF